MDYPIRSLQQLRPILVGFRKQAGLSQQALAEQLGITQQSYAQIEANPASTSVERLYTVLRLLGAELLLSPAGQPSPDAAVAQEATDAGRPQPASHASVHPVPRGRRRRQGRCLHHRPGSAGKPWAGERMRSACTCG